MTGDSKVTFPLALKDFDAVIINVFWRRGLGFLLLKLNLRGLNLFSVIKDKKKCNHNWYSITAYQNGSLKF